MYKKNKADNIVRIPSVHAAANDDLTQEQLRVMLNNELVDIVSNAGIDVPVAPMTYVPEPEIKAQDSDVKLNHIKTPFRRRSGNLKYSLSDKIIRFAVLGVFTIVCIFAFKSSPAYALDNPVEVAGIGSSYDYVEKCFGEPDIGNRDDNMWQYGDVSFLGMDGMLTILFDDKGYVVSSEWAYSGVDVPQAEDSYKSIYNQMSQIYGEIGEQNGFVLSWRMDGYRMLLHLDYKTITLSLY